LNLKG